MEQGAGEDVRESESRLTSSWRSTQEQSVASRRWEVRAARAARGRLHHERGARVFPARSSSRLVSPARCGMPDCDAQKLPHAGVEIRTHMWTESTLGRIVHRVQETWLWCFSGPPEFCIRMRGHGRGGVGAHHRPARCAPALDSTAATRLSLRLHAPVHLAPPFVSTPRRHVGAYPCLFCGGPSGATASTSRRWAPAGVIVPAPAV